MTSLTDTLELLGRLKMKPFDLKKALAGHPVMTRSGDNVTDLHYFKNARNEDCKLQGIMDGGIYSWNDYGCFTPRHPGGHLDLVMKPTKKTYWMNVYRNEETGGLYNYGAIYKEKQHAIDGGTNDAILISFEVEE